MMLDVREVGFRYNGTPVLDRVDLGVDAHEMLAILGPNGAGKTTLLKCMNGILKPNRGAVLVEGEDVRQMAPPRVARRLGYVPQRAPEGRMTVFDAVLLGRKPHITWSVTERDKALAQAAIERLGLAGMALRYVDSLSGGEAQKVSIARALVQEPRVLLLDEPTSSLDLANQLALLQLVREVVDHHGVAAVLTMHDLNLALGCCDRFLFLKDHEVHADVRRDGVTPDIVHTVYGVQVDVVEHGGRPVVIPAANPSPHHA